MKGARELLVGLAFGALVGLAVAGVGGGRALAVLDRVEPDGSGALLLLSLPLALFLAIGAHEGGHLLGGRFAGFRAYFLLVGPLRLERTGGGWRAGVNGRLSTWGGLAAAAPSHGRRLRHRMALYVAGGPGASLLLGVLCLIAALALHSSDVGGLARSEGSVSLSVALSFLFLAVLGVASLLLGFVTLIPGRSGGMYTDGGRLLRLIRGGPELEGEMALIVINGLSLGGARPREWPDDLVERTLTLPPDSFLGVIARQMAWIRAQDRNEPARVVEYLEEALAHAPQLGSMGEAGLRLQAAAYLAAECGEVARARTLVHGNRGSALSAPHHRSLARGAVLLAEGDGPGAAAHLEHALEVVEDALDAGTARFEWEWIRQLLGRARRLAP